MSRLGDIINELVKSERKTLLWTNPNPTSAFAGQTIPVNLNFDAFEIEFTGFMGQPGYRRSETFHTDETTSNTPTNGVLTFITGAGGQVLNALYIFKRTVMVDEQSGGLTFGEVYRATPAQEWARYTLNTGIVPYKIYGIKHYGA